MEGELIVFMIEVYRLQSGLSATERDEIIVHWGPQLSQTIAFT